MENKKITCPYCKAPVTKIGIDLGKVTCEYCNQTFIVEKENETHLEKFFKVWHEEDKRQEEYQNSDAYKRKIEERKQQNKELYKKVLIASTILILLSLLPRILEIISKLIDKI